MSHAASKPLTAKACGPLSGSVRPPGDKSISHRAFLLGLLTLGETRVEGLLEGEDVLRTGRACPALGAKIERAGEGRWRIAARASARFWSRARRSISAMPAPARG